eukprot:15450124-Alexandrium_andersonii.AAC.1
MPPTQPAQPASPQTQHGDAHAALGVAPAANANNVAEGADAGIAPSLGVQLQPMTDCAGDPPSSSEASLPPPLSPILRRAPTAMA